MSHDLKNREKAIAYINGNIYTEKTHTECICNYLDDNYDGNNDMDRNDYKRNHYMYSDAYNQEIYELGFGHLARDEMGDISIFIEEDSLQCLDMKEFIEALKSSKQYSQYKIYNDDRCYGNGKYMKIT